MREVRELCCRCFNPPFFESVNQLLSINVKSLLQWLISLLLGIKMKKLLTKELRDILRPFTFLAGKTLPVDVFMLPIILFISIIS